MQLRAVVDVPATPAGAAMARRLVATTLPAWGLDGSLDDAALVATELFTNALVHTDPAGAIEVELTSQGGQLRIAVADRSLENAPAVREPSAERSSGRGLQIVQALTRSWGVEACTDGKRVWAELAGDRAEAGEEPGSAATSVGPVGAAERPGGATTPGGRAVGAERDPSDDAALPPGDERADRLRSLLHSVDQTPPGLSPEALLDDLLERVRSVLESDTAAVLLRERGSDELVARAARGLEEEVRQGVIVPVGVGFAGSVAARRRPVALDHVDTTTVTNPILWERGLQVMLGVPLLCDNEVIGVLHVGRLERRPFTDADTDLLQVAASRIAAALQTRRLSLEAAAAGLLERSLLPPRLPRLPGMEFAARYVPAEDRAIGGDWYDAFTLASGELWVVCGDVAGHGLPAAVVMGRVRSALRSFALLGGGPARTLELTDHKVQHFEIGAMITAVCARAMPPYDTLEISSAGHPPPVLAARGHEGRLLELPVDPPLGALRGATRRSVQVELDPGDTMLLFTDGLVERRQVPVHEGLERLRHAVVGDRPEAVCRTVMHRLVRNTAPTDDIALLAVGRTPAVPIG